MTSTGRDDEAGSSAWFAKLAPLAPLPAWLEAEARARALNAGAPGALAGGVVAALLALALRYGAQGAPRGLGLLALAPALVTTALVWRRARRGPLALAAAIDRRAGADECVLTATELLLQGRAEVGRAGPRVLRAAREALERTDASRAVPPLRAARRAQWAAGLVLALAGAALPSRARTAPTSPRAARSEPARAPTLRDEAAAREARALAELAERAARERAPEPARAQARALAERALRLADELARGADAARALREADALERDARALERWAASGAQRRGLERALQALHREPAAAELASALARADLRAVDDAARALADRNEARAQRAARAALEQAERAAREGGAEALGDALGEARTLLTRRAATSALAQAVAAALQRRAPGEGARLRAALERAGGDDAALAQALDETLRAFDRTLTEDERRRVAEALAQRAQSDMQELARDRGDARPPSVEEAREQLRAMLEAARRGELNRSRAGAQGARAGAAAEAATRLRLRLQAGGGASASGNGNGNGNGNGASPQGGGDGARGAGRGGDGAGGNNGGNGGASGGNGGAGAGAGDHVASSGERTARLRAGDGFAAPLRVERAPGAAPLTLGAQSVDPLGARATRAMSPPPLDEVRAAGPEALRGLERTPLPSAYRAQVRSYFEP